MTVMIYIKVDKKKQEEVVLFRKGINILNLFIFVYYLFYCFVYFNCFLFKMPTHDLFIYILAYTFDLIKE